MRGGGNQSSRWAWNHRSSNTTRLFRPSTTKSGQPYGVKSVLSLLWRTPPPPPPPPPPHWYYTGWRGSWIELAVFEAEKLWKVYINQWNAKSQKSVGRKTVLLFAEDRERKRGLMNWAKNEKGWLGEVMKRFHWEREIIVDLQMVCLVCGKSAEHLARKTRSIRNVLIWGQKGRKGNEIKKCWWEKGGKVREVEERNTKRGERYAAWWIWWGRKWSMLVGRESAWWILLFCRCTQKQ